MLHLALLVLAIVAAHAEAEPAPAAAWQARWAPLMKPFADDNELWIRITRLDFSTSEGKVRETCMVQSLMLLFVRATP
jgi:hypothetical protein